MLEQLSELEAVARLGAFVGRDHPDLTADELQGAIDLALKKRSQLEEALPEARRSAAVLGRLPKAAELYRQQIELGLDGDPRAALKARVMLRQPFGGRIVLRPGPIS